MRVLHITSGNLYGGVEAFLTTLVRESHAAPGMDTEFAACFEGRFTSELARMGRPAHSLPTSRVSRPLTVLRARRALADLLRQRSYDVVVCHQPWSCVLFAPVIRAAGFPVVMWVHMATDGRHWLERLCRFARPDMAICNSQYTATCTSRWLPHTVVEHVYCPVSARQAATRSERLRLRDELGTREGDLVIVQVSRLERWKGQHVLLSALATVSDVPGWMCWFVGGVQKPSEIRYLKELETRARASRIEHRVRFLGERADVPTILAAADVFCQPNTSPEPFGLSCVEALQSGLPVVTSGIGGAVEIVDGACGVLTAANDATRLAEALRRLILDDGLRARLASASRRRADELCNASTQTRRVEAMLETVRMPPPVMSADVVPADPR